MRVILVEDQALLREGLARLFVDHGHEPVATAAGADGLDALVDEARPDLVVLDIRMPPTFTDEGLVAARDLKNAQPALGVLLLSQHLDAPGAVDLVGAPGFGYLLKDRVLDVDEFIASAERVAAGGSALDPTVVAALVARRPLDALTSREREVLALMAEGLTNNGIAERLVLSARTVEAHVSHAMTKLAIPDSDEVHRRVAAVVTYLRAS